MVAFGCSFCFKEFLVTDHFCNFKPWLRLKTLEIKKIHSQLFKKMFNILLQ